MTLTEELIEFKNNSEEILLKNLRCQNFFIFQKDDESPFCVFKVLTEAKRPQAKDQTRKCCLIFDSSQGFHFEATSTTFVFLDQNINVVALKGAFYQKFLKTYDREEARNSGCPELLRSIVNLANQLGYQFKMFPDPEGNGAEFCIQFDFHEKDQHSVPYVFHDTIGLTCEESDLKTAVRYFSEELDRRIQLQKEIDSIKEKISEMSPDQKELIKRIHEKWNLFKMHFD